MKTGAGKDGRSRLLLQHQIPLPAQGRALDDQACLGQTMDCGGSQVTKNTTAKQNMLLN
jgi:hypothetical protein